MLADVVDVLVDFVSENKQVVVLLDDLGQSLQLILAIDAAGRIAGRAEDEQTRLRRNGGLQLLGRHLEVLFETSLHNDGIATSQQHHLGIAHPVRSGNNDLIARIDQCHDGVADALLGTVRNQNLGRGVAQVVLALQLAGDGLTQVGIAGNGRILRVVLVDSQLGGLFDVVGGVEVGLADAHVNHVDALCLHFTTLLRHRQRSRRCQSLKSFR